MIKEQKKILLIEDDLQLVGMYQRRFELEDFEVMIAEDGHKALRTFEIFKPDLILLDIMLPKIDGFEVLKKIREDSKLNNSLVVVLTNLSSESTAEQLFKYGVTDYIVKADMTPAQVVERVKEIFSIYHK